MVRSREQRKIWPRKFSAGVSRAEDYERARVHHLLFRIATNLALNSLRDIGTRSWRFRWTRPIVADAGKMATSDRWKWQNEHPDIEQYLVEEARKKMIRHAIEKLPEKQRAAVLLHKYQELDYSKFRRFCRCSGERVEIAALPGVRNAASELAPLGVLGESTRAPRMVVMSCQKMETRIWRMWMAA